MTDEEFLVLEPPDTLAALAQIKDEKEKDRLRLLYARVRKKLVDGLGGAGVPFKPGSAIAPVSTSHVREDARSGMLEVGRVVFFVGVAIAIVSLIVLASGNGSFESLKGAAVSFVALYASGGVMSLGAFMWMLGALEQRLIEIRGLLRTRTPPAI